MRRRCRPPSPALEASRFTVCSAVSAGVSDWSFLLLRNRGSGIRRGSYAKIAIRISSPSGASSAAGSGAVREVPATARSSLPFRQALGLRDGWQRFEPASAVSRKQMSARASSPEARPLTRKADWLGPTSTGKRRRPRSSRSSHAGRPRWPKGTTDATGRTRECLRCLRSDAWRVASGLPKGAVSGRAGHDGRRGRARCLVSASLEAPERPARFLNLRKASYVLVR